MENAENSKKQNLLSVFHHSLFFMLFDRKPPQQLLKSKNITNLSFIALFIESSSKAHVSSVFLLNVLFFHFNVSFFKHRSILNCLCVSQLHIIASNFSFISQNSFYSFLFLNCKPEKYVNYFLIPYSVQSRNF